MHVRRSGFFNFGFSLSRAEKEDALGSFVFCVLFILFYFGCGFLVAKQGMVLFC